MSTKTDNLGTYSFSAASGDYSLSVNGYAPSTAAAPRRYSLNSQSFSLSDDMTVDIALPVKEVVVHVQDPSGNPVAGVGVRTNNPYNYWHSINGQGNRKLLSLAHVSKLHNLRHG